MASGTVGAEETRERPRWTETSKVYSRKFHNKANKNKNDDATNDQKAIAADVTADDVATTTTAANDDGNDTAKEDESAPKDNGNAVTTADDSNNVAQPPAVQSPAVEDANSHQQQPNSPIIEVFSSDSEPMNRKEGTLFIGHDENVGVESPPPPARPMVTRIDNMVRINLSAARSNHQDRRQLKRKLERELEEVKRLAKRLQDREAQLIGYIGELDAGNEFLTGVGGQQPQPSGYIRNNRFGNDGGVRRVVSEVGTVGFSDPMPFQHLSVSLMDERHNTQRVVEILEKEKRTPKANQYYRSSDFVFGTGKLPPAESNKKVKGHGSKKRGGGPTSDKQIFKKCGSLLTKLMKHQYGWVFNTPVDVKMMGLHDYYDIIKHPMDLGTVKNRLSRNWYKSPLQFAEDVRLTFRNAKIYNPEGQDVHLMAVELSKTFEERWVEIEAEYCSKLRFGAAYDMGLPTPTPRRAPLPIYASPPRPIIPVPVPPSPVYLETRHLVRSESFSLPVPVESSQKPVYNPPVARAPALKKPKAKDLNKRDMTFEEKQKLSGHLQALPSEKLDSIVQIIKKRNSTLSQHDDEIEVDIDSVDAETLWELDRFVTNYKKSLSKHKRKIELARQRAEAQQAMQAMNPVPPRAEVPIETRADDTNTVAQSSPVHERKDADDASGSSSSSSSSSDSGSSSSDSDSDSSSESESNGG